MALNDTQKPREGQKSQNPEDEAKFTHLGVLTETQRRVAILSKVANGGRGMYIYDMVAIWANEAWEEAKLAGVVTDAMLNPPAHWVKPPVVSVKKRRISKAVTA